MAIVDLFVNSGSSPRLSADDATVQHQMALLLHGDYTKWAWLSFSAATPHSLPYSRSVLEANAQFTIDLYALAARSKFARVSVHGLDLRLSAVDGQSYCRYACMTGDCMAHFASNGQP